MSALDDRRQQAREAAYDAAANVPGDRFAMTLLEASIETATRVRVTPEVIEAAREAYDRDSIDTETNIFVTITAGFRAAGFEVEQ